jgi:hypothetical protein
MPSGKVSERLAATGVPPGTRPSGLLVPANGLNRIDLYLFTQPTPRCIRSPVRFLALKTSLRCRSATALHRHSSSSPLRAHSTKPRRFSSPIISSIISKTWWVLCHVRLVRSCDASPILHNIYKVNNCNVNQILYLVRVRHDPKWDETGMGTEGGYDDGRLQALGSDLEGCFGKEIDNISPDMTRLMLMLSHVPPVRPDAEELASSKNELDKSVLELAFPARSLPNLRLALRKLACLLPCLRFGKVE